MMKTLETAMQIMVTICTFVAVGVFCMILLGINGCSAPDPGYLGPIVHKDAGEDAEEDAGCYPQEPGPKVACETACGLAYQSFLHAPQDAGLIFDYTQCLNDCSCVPVDGETR